MAPHGCRHVEIHGAHVSPTPTLARGSRLAYVRQNALEFGLALAFVISCVAFLIPGDLLPKIATSRTLGAWATVWSIAGGLGGLGVIYGLCRPDPRAEASGLALLCSALGIAAVATIAAVGWLAWSNTLTSAALLGSFAVRIYVIAKAVKGSR